MIQKNKYEQAIKLFPFFSNLSTNDWKSAQIMKVKPNQLYKPHEIKHIIFLLSGSLRVFKVNNAGREVTLYRINEGETCILMLASILGELEYDASLQVECETELLRFPAHTLREWIGKYKMIQQWVFKQFIIRYENIAYLLENIAFSSIYERMMAFFVDKQKEYGQLNITIPITHEQLAIELGTSREVISRNLKLFSEKGAIKTQRGKIQLINLNKS